VDETRNIVLIGMPGVGKSTIGVLLAKALSRDFLDTDVLIQSREGRRLQTIINSVGMEAFCKMEERHVLSLACRGTVIATGGSVVYGDRAMAHLKSEGVVLHLDLPLALLKRRLRDLDARGVVMATDQTLEGLFEKRQPLYKSHADIAIDCTNRTHEHVVKDVITALRTKA
jgi:shikimate kinase